MRIKKIEMQGFKSFVDPTSIDFDLPIVGIVGPNGCGKSNVVDAIRWVMGEQSAKHLRGKAMEDIIFNGSSNRAPLGMASVSLTFSTEDGIVPPEYSQFSEVTVTRKLFRSGDSEYSINKVPCRLRDILDLFLGTGAGTKAYSIIAQGQVDFAINAKPEDRRRLIEEAAGISKFKSRRDAALRRMESTQNNLLRLGDIIAEIRRQIRSLERQVKKAERYHQYRDELRGLELYLSALQFQQKNQNRSAVTQELNQWTEKEAAAQGALSQLELDLDKQRLELTEKEAELSRYQEQNFELSNKLQLARTQKQYKAQEIQSIKEQTEKWQEELESGRSQLTEVEEALLSKQENSGSIEEMTQQARAALDAAQEIWEQSQHTRHEKAVSLEGCRDSIGKLSQELATLKSRLQATEQQLPDLENRLARNRDEHTELQSQCTERKAAVLATEKSLQELLEQVRTLEKSRQDMKQQLEDGSRTREDRQRDLTSLQEELVNKRSRLRSLVELEKSLAGFGEGVQKILKGPKRDGVFGVVADGISTEPQYESALVAALGERLQYIVVESHERSIEAVDFLKKEAGGRSSFLPKNVRARPSEVFPAETEGVIGPLLSKVTIKPDLENIAHYLFNDVLLVDSLDTARALWESGRTQLRFVTLDGDVMDPSGVISGGHAKQDSNNILAKRREIDSLRREVVRLEQEIGLKDDAVSQLEGTLSGVDLELRALDQEWQTLQVNKASLEKELSHQQANEQRLQDQLAALQERIDDLEQNIQTNKQTREEIQNLQTQASTRQSDEENQLSLWQTGLQSAEETLAKHYEAFTESKIKMASVEEREASFRAELNRLQTMKADLIKRIDSRTSEIKQASDKITQLQEEVVALGESIAHTQVQSDELKKQQAESQENFNRKRTQMQEQEIQSRQTRQNLDDARGQTSELKISLTRLDGELNYLTGHISEKYMINLSEVVQEWAEKVPECDDPTARAQELREKIEKIGPVNMEAIPEFEELKEREVFLSSQYEDLENSITNLEKVITKINQTTKERFDDTFKQVQEKFSQVFPRLFKGGKAELKLEDEHDLLNTGVQLFVQPPGKRPSHISLLSGGEKALSAVAFIFSIFLVKPSPFCILDEVDAPLDDANTARFHQLISDMTHRTQFILITHNKMTMDLCNGLFGVTMQEPGCSKVVSVNLDKIEALPQAASA